MLREMCYYYLLCPPRPWVRHTPEVAEAEAKMEVGAIDEEI